MGSVVLTSKALTESDVDQSVGTLLGEEEAELMNRSPRGRGTQLNPGPLPIGHDSGVAPDRYQIPGSLDGGGATDVVRVGVDHRHDRGVGLGSHRIDRPRHLLHRLAGVDRDETAGPFDEYLVGESVADDTPHAVANPMNGPLELGRVLDRVAVADLSLCSGYRY